MPRRNRKKRQYIPGSKPKGLKRPRSFHHGANRDEHFAEAERRFREAEGEAA